MRGIYLFGLLLFVLATGPVQAQAVSGSNEIKVTGVILPAKSVYVDSNSDIKLIVSNSIGHGELKIIYSGTKIKLTPGIKDQYDKILITHDVNQIGEVYNYYTEQILATQSPAPSTFLGVLGNYLKNVSVLFQGQSIKSIF